MENGRERFKIMLHSVFGSWQEVKASAGDGGGCEESAVCTLLVEAGRRKNAWMLPKHMNHFYIHQSSSRASMWWMWLKQWKAMILLKPCKGLGEFAPTCLFWHNLRINGHEWFIGHSIDSFGRLKGEERVTPLLPAPSRCPQASH